MRIFKWPLLIFLGLSLLIAAYFAVVLQWSFSEGERAGWVQKLSKKGWLCKTWEGELAMISMPGAPQEKFYFTVSDAGVAAQVNALVGQRVALHYQEKVGLPTSCFGDSRYFITKVSPVENLPSAVIPTVPAAKP